MKHVLVFLFGLGCLMVTANDASKELKAFPTAEGNMERLVIILPHKDRAEELNYEVELIPGKTLLVDGVNKTKVGLSLESHPLKGWGYTYYTMSGSAMVRSTMMAVPAGAPKVERFVEGSSLKVRYNSRLPIVVYAPKGTELKYRIWSTSTELKVAEKK
ncbi:MAG: ecotin family protein [Lentisphaeria bacterium]|nr:ecotin family protein [Lentisphaeria bacterium]